MDINTVLDLFPIWALFLMTVALVILAIEFGGWLVRYRSRFLKDGTEVPVGPTVGPILALLAFILAFTFGFAASRFEERKQILQNEVNVIRTAYLRAGLLPEPITSESRRLLREYIDVRLAGTEAGGLEGALAQSRSLHDQLWQQAMAAAEKGRPPVNSLFIQSINELIDVHAKRVMVGVRNRVPAIIWVVLYSLMVLAMTGIGYQNGQSKARRPLAGIILVLAFSAVFALIIDLDRPGAGLVRVSQAGMAELKQELAEKPAQ